MENKRTWFPIWWDIYVKIQTTVDELGDEPSAADLMALHAICRTWPVRLRKLLQKNDMSHLLVDVDDIETLRASPYWAPHLKPTTEENMDDGGRAVAADKTPSRAAKRAAKRSEKKNVTKKPETDKPAVQSLEGSGSSLAGQALVSSSRRVGSSLLSHGDPTMSNEANPVGFALLAGLAAGNRSDMPTVIGVDQPSTKPRAAWLAAWEKARSGERGDMKAEMLARQAMERAELQEQFEEFEVRQGVWYVKEHGRLQALQDSEESKKITKDYEKMKEELLDRFEALESEQLEDHIKEFAKYK